MQARKVVLAAALCLLSVPACADPISGYVHRNGAVVLPSSLYTVTHPRTGHYTIRFTTPVEPMANCLIAPADRGHGPQVVRFGPYITNLKESDSSCSFVIRAPNSGVGQDNDFTFIAVPMSN